MSPLAADFDGTGSNHSKSNHCSKITLKDLPEIGHPSTLPTLPRLHATRRRWSSAIATASIHPHKTGRNDLMLASISHQLSTAAADPGMSIALRLVGFLDALSSTPAEPSGRAPCIHADLRRLATKPGEKCGLAAFVLLENTVSTNLAVVIVVGSVWISKPTTTTSHSRRGRPQ